MSWLLRRLVRKSSAACAAVASSPPKTPTGEPKSLLLCVPHQVYFAMNQEQNPTPDSPLPSSKDIRARALSLYTPPFRFYRGYIFDSANLMVADQGGPEDSVNMKGIIAARVRGWGRIAYLPTPEQLQDEMGSILAEALTAYLSRPNLTMVLTRKEIVDLATAAGVISSPPEQSSDDGNEEWVIAPCPEQGVPTDDGDFEKSRYVAYMAEYPEEGCFPLGDPL